MVLEDHGGGGILPILHVRLVIACCVTVLVCCVKSVSVLSEKFLSCATSSCATSCVKSKMVSDGQRSDR